MFRRAPKINPRKETLDMALLTTEIESVLSSGGLVKFPSLSDAGRVSTETGDMVVQNSYSKHNLTVDPGAKIITITGLAEKTADYNCVNIQTIDSVSAIGPVKIPGYVYTGNFSGCVFYLYKTGTDEVTGVHAYNGEVDVPQKRFLRKTKINKVVREFGPGDFYTRNIAQQLCRYPTRGELRLGKVIGDPAGEDSLNFLSCVERTKATTFLFSMKGTMEGVRVKRLLATHEVDF